MSLIFPLTLLGWDPSLLLFYKWGIRSQTDYIWWSRILTQVCSYLKSMFFHLIGSLWSLSSRLSCISLLSVRVLGRSGQWQSQWFLVEALKKWQACHIWEFPFVTREYKMTRFKRTWESPSREILISQLYLVLNICILQNYGFGGYSKRIWPHLRHKFSGERRGSFLLFCPHTNDPNFLGLHFLIWKMSQTVKNYGDKNCHSISTS